MAPLRPAPLVDPEVRYDVSPKVLAAGALAIAIAAGLAVEAIRLLATTFLDVGPAFLPLRAGVAGATTAVFAVAAAFFAYPIFRSVAYPVVYYSILSFLFLLLSFAPIAYVASGASGIAGGTPDAVRTLVAIHVLAYLLVAPATSVVAMRARTRSAMLA